MKLIIGIGNPGEKYKDNRHNVGFMVIDALASKVNSGQWSVSKKFHSTLNTVHRTLTLTKPQTMINSSGKAVKKLVDHYKVNSSKIWVIHDDLDLKLGRYKIVMGKGPREHKGLLSIYESLGTKEFWHVRVGIENRESSQNTEHKTPNTPRISGEAYVLQDFLPEEQEIVNEAIKRIIDELVSTSFSKQT